ncbi:hypothetical protein [Streptomyces sp. NPDC057939]|uniref:hypothetical protein n=1 Tax=Streptomyces sp. NPDC057939 TaxID=3346284 RepID=UPI0036EC5804
MRPSIAAITVLAFILLISTTIACLAAALTGVLARIDGATLPASLLRAGVAFGGTLTLMTGLLGVGLAVIR